MHYRKPLLNMAGITPYIFHTTFESPLNPPALAPGQNLQMSVHQKHEFRSKNRGAYLQKQIYITDVYREMLKKKWQ